VVRLRAEPPRRQARYRERAGARKSALPSLQDRGWVQPVALVQGRRLEARAEAPAAHNEAGAGLRSQPYGSHEWPDRGGDRDEPEPQRRGRVLARLMPQAQQQHAVPHCRVPCVRAVASTHRDARWRQRGLRRHRRRHPVPGM